MKWFFILFHNRTSRTNVCICIIRTFVLKCKHYLKKTKNFFKKSSISSYLTILIREEAGVELTFDTFYKEGYNNKSRDLQSNSDL